MSCLFRCVLLLIGSSLCGGIAAAEIASGGTLTENYEARQIPFSPLLACQSGDGPIAASIYSLPASLFSVAEVEPFLSALFSMKSERTTLLLSDLDLRVPDGVTVLHPSIDGYSPWPRDPFCFASEASGAVTLVTRPGFQPGREADRWMAAELVRLLADRPSTAWEKLHWSIAPMPFHNGQILSSDGQIWISLHTLEPRILALLGLERLPIDHFDDAAEIDRYLAAAADAAEEIAALFAGDVRFVHPLPTGGPAARRRDALFTIGGGAGFDLDSLLTIVSQPDGAQRALVADLALGSKLLQRATDADLRTLQATYNLDLNGDRLAQRLITHAVGESGQGLQTFLDLVAVHLSEEGIDLERLPLILVPTSIIAGDRQLARAEVILTWNNVVLTPTTAEGFAGGFAPGDRYATTAFERLHRSLFLLPPLVESILRNGGYRCASNHLRRSPAGD